MVLGWLSELGWASRAALTTAHLFEVRVCGLIEGPAIALDQQHATDPRDLAVARLCRRGHDRGIADFLFAPEQGGSRS
ncbi:hypothetical protein EV644_112109 [Kribbella orskensis]|uniref:Uncharacterized protein n=1 Tax=Kribbella orskensis TaxID=2512216 RepID=A0ABY2BH41_9ACTN|nr:hypothetical protein EV642_113109 [Kribbella sp. VKM Ac-2500]TCO18361.1 hypothetical protein EV644_112109 [Kribbella orskensis]